MDYVAERDLMLRPAKVTQILSEEKLKQILPNHDGWIIGDDLATRAVFEVGHAGRLRAAVKWGIGVDNVDFAACKNLGIPIINMPDVSPLRDTDRVILGTHNRSNTLDAVIRASHTALARLSGFF